MSEIEHLRAELAAVRLCFADASHSDCASGRELYEQGWLDPLNRIRLECRIAELEKVNALQLREHLNRLAEVRRQMGVVRHQNDELRAQARLF